MDLLFCKVVNKAFIPLQDFQKSPYKEVTDPSTSQTLRSKSSFIFYLDQKTKLENNNSNNKQQQPSPNTPEKVRILS